MLGSKYILIIYHYDVNAIIAEPLKDRTVKSIANAHERIYDYLTIRGLKPKFEILDNECSREMDEEFNEAEVRTLACTKIVI